MKVMEIRLKVFLLQDIEKAQTYTVIADYIDSCMAKDENFLKFHKENRFKYYSFDQLYPIEKDGIYKKNHIYTVRIRTIRNELAQYLAVKLANHYNNQLKGLTREIRMIPQKLITDIYTLTPVIIKGDNKGEGGYWKNFMSVEEFETRLKSNLYKKYNSIVQTNIDEDFELYNSIEFLNHKPIGIPYKNITLLGDKLNIKVADNEMAQKIMYMSIATGILENNARGAGFVNYRFL